MGSGSTRWRNGYFSRLDAFQLYVNSTTAYVNEIVTTIDLVNPSNYAIATETAVANLFGTIETITGVTITNMESVGMVTRYSGASASDYVLTAADTWVHKNTLNYWELELISGSDYRLILTDDYNITTFSFFTTASTEQNNLIFGVRDSVYALQISYIGSAILFLGSNSDTAETDASYTIEVMNNMRMVSLAGLYFGGVLADETSVHLNYDKITIESIATDALAVTGVLYATDGITTDETNVWKLGGYGVGTPTPTGNVAITINGVTKYIAVGDRT